MNEDLEEKVEQHSLKIRELEDEMSFKRWKFDELFEKIDKLTEAVQNIQLNQLHMTNKLESRVTQLETTNSNLKWIIGVGFTGLSVIVAYLSLLLNFMK